jgi:hypothetical protein
MPKDKETKTKYTQYIRSITFSEYEKPLLDKVIAAAKKEKMPVAKFVKKVLGNVV